MTATIKLLSIQILIPTVAALAVGSALAAEELDAATEELKACVSKHLSKEKEKSNPNANNLMNICNQQLNAVIELLPVGTASKVEDHVLHDVEHLLTEP